MKKGFTLIELLVVMVVTVVIMAIALPSFFSISKGHELRGTTSSIHSTISLTRQWAITHRTPTWVEIVSNQIQVASEEGIVSLPVKLPPTIRVDMFYNPDDQNISWLPTTNIGFNTSGGLNVEHNHKIVLTESNSPMENVIMIHWLTGGINIQ